MKTLILPGFSTRNSQWAEEVKSRLGEETFIHEWKHWQTQNSSDFKVEKEVAKILEGVGSEEINIVAKSIGTYVSLSLLNKIPDQIKKVILCGIPTSFLREYKYDVGKYDFFKKFPAKNVVVFQNNQDPLASYLEVKKLFSNINPKIEVVEKPRSDHDYPYFTDFQKFLNS